MQGRRYLDLAREILRGNTEVHWRGASGREYYALLLECRNALHRWGIAGFPPRDRIHAVVRLKFIYATNADLKQIGRELESLGRLRSNADYDLSPQGRFANNRDSADAIKMAADMLVLLDAIDADASRRAAAIAAIPKTIP